jgi:hypothetical protein
MRPNKRDHAFFVVPEMSTIAMAPQLEHFPIGMNRLGFPNQRISDSRCVLAKEARHFRVFSRAIPKTMRLKSPIAPIARY